MGIKLFLITVLVFCNTITYSQKINYKALNQFDFIFNLFSEISKEQKNQNFSFSPFSIYTCFAAVYIGSANETKTQMANTIGYNKSFESFKSEFKLLNDNVLSADSKSSEIFSSANCVYMNQNVSLLAKYLETNKLLFNPELKVVDFSKPELYNEIAQNINNYVEEHTNHKIVKIISASDFNVLTRLILINSVYFYSPWKNAFDTKLSGKDFFTDYKGVKNKIMFMHNEINLPYFEDSSIQAIEMPYISGKYSMVVILPKSYNSEAITNNIYQNIIHQLVDTKVNVQIPKFKVETSIQLNDILIDLGMKDAFTSKADFSGITGNRDLFISKSLHKCFVEVSEAGTEAAAATAIIMQLKSARVEEESKIFKANHPFIFIIKENSTQTPLFIGNISESPSLN
jgi:serpin B